MVDTSNDMWLDDGMNNNDIANKVIEARNAYEAATSRKARNEAAEELEFWTNKNAAAHIATTNGW